jgi:glycosyltransferase involved in cell wall biosynthesis
VALVARCAMTEQRVHVMLAVPALDRGGPEKVMFELACALDRAGWRVSVVVLRADGDYLGRLPSSISVHVLDPGHTRLSSRYPVIQLTRLVRTVRPEVLLTTLRMNSAGAAARCLWGRHTRLVARVANHASANAHELRDARLWTRFGLRVSLLALRRADLVIAQSTSMRDDLLRRLPAHSVITIGNPVGSEEPTGPADLPGNPALIAVGRLAHQKGFDVLLEAFRHVRGEFPSAELTVFGDGELRTALEQQRAGLGLDDVVHLRGQAASVLGEIQAADVFVSSSRYEGFSNAILEALALGTPVVATTCPGAATEVIMPGMDGLLVPPGDARALADAISQAVRASWDRGEIARRTRTAWSIERIGREYDRALRRTIGGVR